MTIPRQVGLTSTEDGPRLTQKPVNELDTIAEEAQQFKNVTISDGLFTDENLEGTTYKIEADIQLNDADRVGFNLRKGDEEQTIVGYNVMDKKLFVDRRNSGDISFHEDFAADFQTAPLRLKENILTLEILVDRSSVEVFTGNGERSITNRIFPGESSTGIEIFSEGGAAEVLNLDFLDLQSTWSKSQ